MHSFSLLKIRAGILLAGDHTSLTRLHNVVHNVNDHPPLVIDKEGSFFFGLALDVRKAYERQREVTQPGIGDHAIAPRPSLVAARA